MRRFMVAGVVLLAALAVAAPATAAPPCTGDDDGALKLRAPDRVAYDREGVIVVDGSNGWLTEGMSNARLDMRDAATGAVFYSRDFTAEEMAAMTDLERFDGQRFTFYVFLNRGDGPAIIRLAYDRAKSPDYKAGPCSMVIERMVSPFAGIAPKISASDLFSGYNKDQAVIKIVSKQPNCDVTPVQPVTVTLRGEGRKVVVRNADPCTIESKRWSQKGRAPGLDFAGNRVSRNELRLYLRTTGSRSFDRYYRLTVQRGQRAVLRRWINAWVYVTPTKRFWEGSDAFWNYCIRGNRDILSSGGRLYCVRYRQTDRQVFVSRKPPRR